MIVLTAFEAVPGAGTEAGLAWNWACAYIAEGRDVTVLTSRQAGAASLDETWLDAGIRVEYLGESVHARIPQSPVDFILRSRDFRRWTAACTDWITLNADSITSVHHVSWGSVRLRPPLTKVKEQIPTVWGPLGGGQLPKFSGLLRRSVIHELIRVLTFPLGWLMRRIDFAIGRKPSLSLATNTATARFVRSLGIDAVQPMLADGIDSKFIVAASDKVTEGPIRLVWLGRMVASKRPDIALGVIAELISRGVPANLTMLGDGPEREILLDKARKLGILSSVCFVGRIPWSQTFDFYDRSHFLLFTSMRDSSCPAVLEAAARGVPTLCLRHQGVASQVPESVAFGPRRFGSSSELEEKLADLAVALTADPDGYKAAVHSAISFARTQTWAKKVASVLNSMNGVAGR